MRKISIMVQCLMLTIILLMINGCASTPSRPKFIGHSFSAAWSKDGRTIFYADQQPNSGEKTKLYSYNLDTKLGVAYHNLSRDVLKEYDINPNNSLFVFAHSFNTGQVIGIGNLQTGNRKQIAYLPDASQAKVFWLPNNRILYWESFWSNAPSRVYVMNTNGTHKERLVSGVDEVYPSVDGKICLVCTQLDHGYRYRIFDLGTKASRPLRAPTLTRIERLRILYLSSTKLAHQPLGGGRWLEVIDLATMKIDSALLPDVNESGYRYGTISADRKHCWIAQGSAYSQQGDLRVLKLPEEAAKKLR